MNEQEKVSTSKKDSKSEQTDEIGNELETGDEVNAAIEKQGDDAAAGISRDTDAAKQEGRKHKGENDNNELTGAP